VNPIYSDDIGAMRMPGKYEQKFSDIYPEVEKNPEIRPGVWVRFEGSDGDWFVTEVFGDFAQLKQKGLMAAEKLDFEGEKSDERIARLAKAGQIKAKRTGELTIVPW
jgi:hypothetical protein